MVNEPPHGEGHFYHQWFSLETHTLGFSPTHSHCKCVTVQKQWDLLDASCFSYLQPGEFKACGLWLFFLLILLIGAMWKSRCGLDNSFMANSYFSVWIKGSVTPKVITWLWMASSYTLETILDNSKQTCWTFISAKSKSLHPGFHKVPETPSVDPKHLNSRGEQLLFIGSRPHLLSANHSWDRLTVKWRRICFLMTWVYLFI